ncbi:hypothetical protein BsWGS_26762 [Bradybaena similaris]
MGKPSTNLTLILIYTTFAAVIVCLEAATGRRYGTWVDRRRERECQRSLVCEYRQANCMNNTPQNQWRCTAITNSMQAKMCTLQTCQIAQGMLCLETDPGGNMTEVPSNTCAIGQKCYASVTMTTSVTLGTTDPAITLGTTDSAITLGQTTGVPETTNVANTEETTGSQLSTNPWVTSIPPGNETLTTTGIPDVNAIDTIWSSAIQGNSTPQP